MCYIEVTSSISGEKICLPVVNLGVTSTNGVTVIFNINIVAADGYWTVTETYQEVKALLMPEMPNGN